MSARIEERLADVPAVLQAQASSLTGAVLVTYDETIVSSRTVCDATLLFTAARPVVPAAGDYAPPPADPSLC
jgi:copper chaperone CopZ